MPRDWRRLALPVVKRQSQARNAIKDSAQTEMEWNFHPGWHSPAIFPGRGKTPLFHSRKAGLVKNACGVGTHYLQVGNTAVCFQKKTQNHFPGNAFSSGRFRVHRVCLAQHRRVCVHFCQRKTKGRIAPAFSFRRASAFCPSATSSGSRSIAITRAGCLFTPCIAGVLSLVRNTPWGRRRCLGRLYLFLRLRSSQSGGVFLYWRLFHWLFLHNGNSVGRRRRLGGWRLWWRNQGRIILHTGLWYIPLYLNFFGTCRSSCGCGLVGGCDIFCQMHIRNHTAAKPKSIASTTPCPTSHQPQ